MLLSLFLYILVLFLLITFLFKKKLHRFEVLFIWMTVWLITHSVSSILVVNLHILSISRELDDFWVHVLKRLILYPLIIIHFIDATLRLKSSMMKVLLLAANVMVMVCLEFCFISVGVLKSSGFRAWHGMLEWAFTIALTYIIWMWYHRKHIRRL